jgi:hypothetical protein
MAIAKRLEMEREAFLEQIRIDGVVVINRKKFILLGGGKNMSRTVSQAWLESWRDYIDDEDGDLNVLQSNSSVIVLYDDDAVAEGVQSLEAL